MIFGKVGRLGHGKTMRAVVDALELAQQRSAVLASNIRVRVPAGVEFYQLPMDEFSRHLSELIERLMSCERCTVLDEWGDVGHGEDGCQRQGLVLLVDEVDTIWDAHGWADMAKVDRFLIKQSRKLGIDVYWTAQFVDQVEKSIRNITEEVELMRALPTPSLRRRQAGKRPMFIRGQRFRPGAVRELTASPDADKRLGSSWHRYRREHETLYKTDELVRPAVAIEPNPRCKNECCRDLREACPALCCRPPAMPEVQATVPMVLRNRHPEGAQARERSDRAGGAVDGAGGSRPLSTVEGSARSPRAGEHGVRPLSSVGSAGRGHEVSRAPAPGGRSPWEPF